VDEGGIRHGPARGLDRDGHRIHAGIAIADLNQMPGELTVAAAKLERRSVTGPRQRSARRGELGLLVIAVREIPGIRSVGIECVQMIAAHTH